MNAKMDIVDRCQSSIRQADEDEVRSHRQRGSKKIKE